MDECRICGARVEDDLRDRRYCSRCGHELSYMRTSRVNQLLVMVNARIPIDQADIRTAYEAELYRNFWAEAVNHQDKYGFWPVFDMGEIEYDDPILSIYGDD